MILPDMKLKVPANKMKYVIFKIPVPQPNSGIGMVGRCRAGHIQGAFLLL